MQSPRIRAWDIQRFSTLLQISQVGLFLFFLPREKEDALLSVFL